MGQFFVYFVYCSMWYCSMAYHTNFKGYVWKLTTLKYVYESPMKEINIGMP